MLGGAARMEAEIAPSPGEAPAPVVEGEQGSPWQICQCLIRLDRRSETVDQFTNVGDAPDTAGQWGREDVAHSFVRRGRQQTGRSDTRREGFGVRDRAQLYVAPRGEFHLPVAEIARCVGERLQLDRGEESAG